MMMSRPALGSVKLYKTEEKPFAEKNFALLEIQLKCIVLQSRLLPRQALSHASQILVQSWKCEIKARSKFSVKNSIRLKSTFHVE